jgi:ribose transport system permease protein
VRIGSDGTDRLVALAREAGPAHGIYGAKITGGGSGGTVAVLADAGAGDAIRAIARQYAEDTGRDAYVFEGTSSGAAHLGAIRLAPRHVDGTANRPHLDLSNMRITVGTPGPKRARRGMRKELATFLLFQSCARSSPRSTRFLSPPTCRTRRADGAFGIFSLDLVWSIPAVSIVHRVGVHPARCVNHADRVAPAALRRCCSSRSQALGCSTALITRLGLQPFIVTLCGLLLYRGLARFIADDETKGFGDAAGFETLQWLATGSLFHVPTPFLALVVVSIAMWVLLHRSVYGRHLYATGRNETAAIYSGINARRVVVSAYVILGVLTGVAAIVFAFYTNSVSPSSHGNFFALYGIAAAVLGGCSLRGGEGSIVGILLGTTLLQVLQNLVNLLGIPSSLNFAVMGGVILIGVVGDQVLQRRAARVRAR